MKNNNICIMLPFIGVYWISFLLSRSQKDANVENLLDTPLKWQPARANFGTSGERVQRPDFKSRLSFGLF